MRTFLPLIFIVLSINIYGQSNLEGHSYINADEQYLLNTCDGLYDASLDAFQRLCRNSR